MSHKLNKKFSVLHSMQYFQNPNVFFIPNGLRVFKEASNINHWQLRDLMQCSPLFDELYFVQGKKIKRFPYPSDVKSFFDLDSLISQAETSENASSSSSSKNLSFNSTMDLDEIEDLYNLQQSSENQKKNFWKEHFSNQAPKTQDEEIKTDIVQDLSSNPLLSLENTSAAVTGQQNIPQSAMEEEEGSNSETLILNPSRLPPQGIASMRDLVLSLAQTLVERTESRRQNTVTSVIKQPIKDYKYESRVLLEPGWECCSFTLGGNFIAAGSGKSNLYVGELKKNAISKDDGKLEVKTEVSQIFNKSLNASINNCTKIASFAANPSSNASNSLYDHVLFLSNNDETVKVFSLAPKFTCIDCITVGHPVNYVDISPALSIVATVSDSPYIKIFDIRDLIKEKATLTQKSNSYEKPPTDAPMFSHRRSGAITPKSLDLNYSGDSGFCCSFNYSGLELLTSSQDGTVTLWDLRKTQKELKRFCSTKNQSKNPEDYLNSYKYLNSKKENANFARLTCLPIVTTSPISSFSEKIKSSAKHLEARACKFCKFPPFQDLIVFAEHESRIHIIDTKNDNNYENEQIIDLDKELKWISIQQKKMSEKNRLDPEEEEETDAEIIKNLSETDSHHAEIAGFDFSRDGEFLFVKTLTEVFQFKMNLNARKFDLN